MGLIGGYMVVELIAGLIANSLALLADAAHMVTDALAIGIALLAVWVAARPASARRTFGFQRAEVLAALLNALSLWLIAAWIFVTAARRFVEPPEVQASMILTVGLVGLLINVAAALVLRRSARHNLNVQGALLHVMSDLFGSIAVIAAGIVVITLDWAIVDPIFGVIIGFLIVLSSTRLLWKVSHVLMEGTPSRMNVQQVCQALEQVPGVNSVHDIHIWSLTSGYEVLSAHVTAARTTVKDRGLLLHRLRDLCSQKFGIAHVTIQVEDPQAACEEAHHFPHDERPSS